MPPTLDRRALRGLIASAMRRGVPRADAEDIVLRAWEKAAPTFDPTRGTLEALLQRVVIRDAAEWWRQHRTFRERADQLGAESVHHLHGPRPEDRARAHAHQQELLDRLSEEERKVFAAWALQRHLPQGALPAPRAARSVGLTTAEYNNAKKRLARRVRAILGELGVTPRDLWTVAEDEGPRSKRHA